MSGLTRGDIVGSFFAHPHKRCNKLIAASKLLDALTTLHQQRAHTYSPGILSRQGSDDELPTRLPCLLRRQIPEKKLRSSCKRVSVVGSDSSSVSRLLTTPLLPPELLLILRNLPPKPGIRIHQNGKLCCKSVN